MPEPLPRLSKAAQMTLEKERRLLLYRILAGTMTRENWERLDAIEAALAGAPVPQGETMSDDKHIDEEPLAGASVAQEAETPQLVPAGVEEQRAVIDALVRRLALEIERCDKAEADVLRLTATLKDSQATASKQIDEQRTAAKVAHDGAITAEADVLRLTAELTLTRGAMAAQEERETNAGHECGVLREQFGCDWPEAVADAVVRLTAEQARLYERFVETENALRQVGETNVKMLAERDALLAEQARLTGELAACEQHLTIRDRAVEDYHTTAEVEIEGLRTVLQEYLDWGAMTGSDRDLFEQKFREVLAKKVTT